MALEIFIRRTIKLLKSINKSPITPQSEKLELVIYSKVGLGDGSHANNPWLQELPDPISRVTWDNYLTISNVDAKKNGLHNRSLITAQILVAFLKFSKYHRYIPCVQCRVP